MNAETLFEGIRELIASGELVTITRAAEHVGVTRQTLYEHLTNGHLSPAFTIDDGTNLFYKPSLDQFMKVKRGRGRPRKNVETKK